MTGSNANTRSQGRHSAEDGASRRSSRRAPVAAARRRPLPALTGLRFFAAVHVMLLHYVWDVVAPGRDLPVGAVTRGILSSGYLGVSLFFVLSGFILTYNYLDPGGTRPIDRGAFWNARVARVYPAYLFSLVVALPTVWRWAALKMATEPVSAALPKVLSVATLNPALLQAWIPATVPQWNAPGWSLSVEAAFYALFPTLAPAFATRGARRPILTGVALWSASAAVPAAYCLLAARPYLSPVGAGQPTMTLTAISYFPLLHLPEFLIGVMAGRLFLDHDSERSASSRAAWGRIADLLVVAYPLILAITPALPYPLLHNGLLAPFYAILIYALAAGDGLGSRLLGTSAILLLGEASYALYLLHLPLLGRVAELFAALDAADTPRWLPIGLAAVASLLSSVAVLKLVEEPARRAVRRSLDARLARRRASRVRTGTTVLTE